VEIDKTNGHLLAVSSSLENPTVANLFIFNRREWIWVEDNVRMVYDLMISDIGIWNIGSGDSWTNKQIIEEVGLIMDKKVNFEFVADRLGHDGRYTIDISKLEYHYETIRLTTKDIRTFLLERFGK
jgi:dTDP-D-glucose 4,6-dehydratase